MSEAYDYSKPFEQRARVSLEDREMRRIVGPAVDRNASGRTRSMTSLRDPEAVRELGAQVRDFNLSHLDQHLERLAETWTEAGGKIFFAQTAEEAASYVVSVAKKSGATEAVKSKSMVTEEIGLNEALTEAGIEPIETDLGQYIVQLAGEPPSHIVAPSVHKSKEQVTDLFSLTGGERLENDADVLTEFARKRQRPSFLSAGVGISGVNMAVADEGTLCLVTNEGNGRLCTSMPPVHIAVMGMERVVWDFDQLAVILCLLGRGNTGQKLSQYTSLLHGPKRSAEIDGPTESHLVIIDNNRSNLLGTRYQSALRCIRCGACLNICPVFRQVSGYAYDPVYSGPIGAVITPLLKGVENAGELAHASTLCGACTSVCPVKIPLHDLLLYIRQDFAPHTSATERAAYKAWSLAWSKQWGFALTKRAGRVLGRVTGGRPLRRLYLPLMSRWTKGRHFPGFPGGKHRPRP
ncbi:MAG: LutB/LldF family L-lactate oxidation iron-sulfur protein [Actinomycetota bacterium]|nr:LutB/LldF family L-lactate oxidation iron-sulfur protein [Actinomycetota bacterium]